MGERKASRRKEGAVGIGAFSVSLAVKDLEASRAFYEKLGFTALGGDPAQNWLILKNEDCVIGLFQGMFEKNILTFNPGWDENAQEVNPFQDVRVLQEVDPSTPSGPGYFMIEDPDGNPILVDQHR